jgi:hypothetical protein
MPSYVGSRSYATGSVSPERGNEFALKIELWIDRPVLRNGTRGAGFVAADQERGDLGVRRLDRYEMVALVAGIALVRPGMSR